jgi:gas vesicle protein
MAERDSDFGSFLSGFLVGGMIGAVVALLFAPQSGEETRTMIRDKGIEIKDKTVQSAEEAYARAEAAAAEARARADELAQMARERADELKQRGQVILEAAKTPTKATEPEAPPAPKTQKKTSTKKSPTKKS